MMDAYSFDKDEESMMETYKKIRATYFKAFEELGLDIVAVAADNGSILTKKRPWTEPNCPCCFVQNRKSGLSAIEITTESDA